MSKFDESQTNEFMASVEQSFKKIDVTEIDSLRDSYIKMIGSCNNAENNQKYTELIDKITYMAELVKKQDSPSEGGKKRRNKKQTKKRKQARRGGRKTRQNRK